jgi:hypothetical protein
MLVDGTMEDRPVSGGVTTEMFTLGSAPYGECPLHSGLFLDTSYTYTDTAMPFESLETPLPTPGDVAAGIHERTQLTPVVFTDGPRAEGTTMSATPASLPGGQPSLRSMPTPAAPLPGVPVRSVAGMKVERVARPDGSIVTVIKNRN